MLDFLGNSFKTKNIRPNRHPCDREVNGEEGERVVVGLRLLANDPGQAESGSLCSDTGENSPP